MLWIIALYTVFCVGLALSALFIIDKDEPEPLLLILGAFLWGAVPSILIAWGALRGGTNLLTVALVEEGLKGFLLTLYLLCYREEVCNKRDIFLYSILIGVGFAYGEGLYYLTLGLYPAGVFIYVLLHTGWVLCTGLGLLWGYHVKSVWPAIMGVSLAVTGHLLYDYWVSYNPTLASLTYFISLGVMLVGYILLCAKP